MKPTEHGTQYELDIFFQDLLRRDPLRRFNKEEKRVLAYALEQAWKKQTWLPEHARVINFSQIAQLGNYPDQELYTLINTKAKQELLDNPQPIYLTTNIETPEQLIGTLATLKRLGKPPSTLVTMYFPLQRGDRPEHKKDDLEEVVLLEDFICNLEDSGVKRIMLFDSHSPAFSYFALKCGISVLDLSMLPTLFNDGLNRGFFEGAPLYAVSGDDGATEMAKLIEMLVCTQGMECIGHLEGAKTRKEGKTTIEFDSDALSQINGKIAIIGEDIISTGGTLNNVINQLLNAGALRVVVLVTYPIFAGNALKILGNKENVFVITTDGRTPQQDIRAANNIIQLPVKNNLEQLVELEKKGINLWDNEGQLELWRRGFCLAPWQTHLN